MASIKEMIVPKSDRLCADNLLLGTMTIEITHCTEFEENDRKKLKLFYKGSKNPYIPCVTMLRGIGEAWGEDYTAYVGRQMLLFREPTVTFGTSEVGGIQISHFSHIKHDFTMALTAGRHGKKRMHTFKVLKTSELPKMPYDEAANLINSADSLDQLKLNWTNVANHKSSFNAEEMENLKALKETKKEELDFGE